jgi:ribosome-associated protein
MHTADEICLAIANELEETFVRASGPGGQNVNKAATAVELRFDVRRSKMLPATVRARLERLAGRKLTGEGVLVIKGDRFRTQEQNRKDVRERLFDLVRHAAVVPRQRVKTHPPPASKKSRLIEKSRRGEIKRRRRIAPTDE